MLTAFRLGPVQMTLLRLVLVVQVMLQFVLILCLSPILWVRLLSRLVNLLLLLRCPSDEEGVASDFP
jgi:hypothetical protein